MHFCTQTRFSLTLLLISNKLICCYSDTINSTIDNKQLIKTLLRTRTLFWKWKQKWLSLKNIELLSGVLKYWKKKKTLFVRIRRAVKKVLATTPAYCNKYGNCLAKIYVEDLFKTITRIIYKRPQTYSLPQILCQSFWNNEWAAETKVSHSLRLLLIRTHPAIIWLASIKCACLTIRMFKI